MNNKVKDRFIWLNGEIMHVGDAKVNVLSPTSQFGLNVFEGIRCYYNKEENQLYAFRLDDHYRRLKKSQKLLMLEDKYTLEELKEAFFDVIKAEDYREDIAVRQTLFIEGYGSWSSKEELGMFIAPIPKSKTNIEYNKKGLHCCISSWQRINDNSLSPRIKCGANYINSRMAQLEAIRNGYDTTIFLNNHGTVAEGPGSCLFLIKDGVLITPKLTDSVLESITRDTIIKLARQVLHMDVIERSVDRTELYDCDESFLCGSAMEITPVYSVDRYDISSDMGIHTKAILESYIKCVTNDIEQYSHWVIPIY